MRFPIHEDDAGQRVDRFLRQWLRRAPISMLQRWIRQGQVRIDGERAEPGAMLEVGREFEIVIDQADLADFVTEPVSQPDRPGRPVVHRHQDQHLWIVDKPAGLAVQGGRGLEDDLQTRVRAAIGPSASKTFRPSPAHRLDRPTSGLVMVGVSAPGLRGLNEALREHRVDKIYLALIEGNLDPTSGLIDAPLRVDDREDDGLTQVDLDGVEARTRYRVVARGESVSAVRVVLETGRRHQIRAHFQALGHPIVGDVRYDGRARSGFGEHRIALHAERLRLDHPVTGERLDVTSPIPDEFRRLLTRR